MTNFTWNKWLGTLLSQHTARKPRRARVAQVEGLENRALLTAPVANADTYSVDQDTTLTATTSVLANDTDADGDAINQAILQNNVTSGTLTLNTNGTFTYVPNAGFTGADTFTYFALDAANEQSTTAATVTINVTVNAAPVVSNVTLSGTLNTPVTGTLTGTDADGDTLTFAEGATAETNGTVVINSNGNFTFTPTNGFTGVATFSYRANDGSLNSSDATVTINVSTPANTAPTVSNVTLSGTINTNVTGTLTGTDVDGDTLTFAEGATAETNGTVVINSNGSFTFTPTTDFTGVATFSYRANDGSLNSSDATVTINISAANTAPVVNNVTLSGTINTNVTGTLTGTDADGDTLTFAEGATAETNGTVVINSNGTFTFTPTTDFTGTATFSYRANDGSLNSSDATVTITISAANTAPVVSPVSLTGTENTAVTGTLTGTDADGDTLTFAEGATAETNGTVVINSNGTFTFTPTTDFTGVATFSYRANDGTVNSADATVTIVISAINTAPVVINGTGTTNVNTNLNGSLVSLATDAQGDALTFAVVAQPSDGSVTVNSNGTFTFNPDTDFVGTTSFTFTASDGLLTSNVGTFTVTVTDTTEGDFDLDLDESVTISNNPSSPTALDPSAALVNVAAGTDFANAQVTASFVSGVDSKKDRLVVIKKNGDVRVKGKKIFVNNTQVATITSGNKKGSALSISFNSSATEASVEAVLQSIAIQTRPSASTSVRVIQFQVSADGTTATDTIDASIG